MKSQEIAVRAAVPEDAERLVEIYAPYVRETAISFEYEVPSVEEFRARMERVLRKYPYLVAVADGRIIGYVYVSPFVGRVAYDWAVATSIYVDRQFHRCGVGGRLYAALEQVLKKMNIKNLNACIGYPDIEDEFLTKNSAEFHAHLGYRLVGRFEKCGYKFGRWYDMIWMEKLIADHEDVPTPVKSFDQVRNIIREKYGIR